MNAKLVAETLNRDEVRSRVMRDGAFFDAFIGIAIGMYFTNEERFQEFETFEADAGKRRIVSCRIHAPRGSAQQLA